MLDSFSLSPLLSLSFVSRLMTIMHALPGTQAGGMLAKVKAAGAEAATKAAAAAASAAKDAASKAKDAAPGILASAKEAASKAKDAAAGSETLQKAKSSAVGLVSAVRSRAEAIPPEDRQRYSEVATTVLTLASACGVRGAGRSVGPSDTGTLCGACRADTPENCMCSPKPAPLILCKADQTGSCLACERTDLRTP
jgi:hypothetical protein